MAAPPSSPAVQAVLEALDALYKSNDRAAMEQANTWLQDFQKTPDAWDTANVLLLAQDLPVEPRLFAAQTFRMKTTFDLDQVPLSARSQLRDTLIHALAQYSSGPRVIQTQICLSLSGLALQMLDWDNVVPSMIERFGSDPATVGALLEFLTVLPEEVTTNHRIPIGSEDYSVRVRALLTENAAEILKILSIYVQAQGITSQIQTSIFHCLRSWLKAGEISALQMVETPLFQLSFDALTADSLFDVAVDVVCDLIHETQEIQDNMQVIELIVPRLAQLRPQLAKAGDDEDRVRGFCRIFVQAGETYHHLIIRHKENFLPIVEAIAECAAYHDLDIVSITFQFWYLLASGLGKSRDDPSNQPFFQLYERLLVIIIGHLRFPDDPDTMTGQDRDDFRQFRHFMGDTLKDCCHVLGPQECLGRSLHMIQVAVAASGGGSGGNLKWQDVEAPLFSMRAMGAEADPRDDEVVPRIIDIIPSLPDHPKLKYAGLLVMCRYTEWIDMHPDRIPQQLSYISASLGHPDQEVSAAAAQAMNFLCQDCKRHLVPYLPQVFDFYGRVGNKIGHEDLVSVAEAIGHIIASMPAQDAFGPLLQFAQPLLETVDSVVSKPGATKDDLKLAADRMEQLERFLYIVGNRYRSDFPESCAQTCVDAYQVLDKVMSNYGGTFFISERISHLIRRALNFYGSTAMPVLPALLNRLASSFEATGFPGYVWIIGKCIDAYGRKADAPLRAAMQNAFDSISARVMAALENTMPNEISDVLDDYVHTCEAAAGNTPSLVFLSPMFPGAIRTALAALTLLQPQVIDSALQFIREVVGHDALSIPPTSSQPGTPLPPPADPTSGPSPQELAAYSAAIRHVVGEQGFQLCGLLLTGLVTHFSSESMPVVLTTFRVLAAGFPAESASWVPAAAESLPVSNVPAQDRVAFVEAFSAAIHGRDLEGVKTSLTGLYGASRKARERSRVNRDLALLDR